MATHPYPVHIVADVLRLLDGKSPLEHPRVTVYDEEGDQSVIHVSGFDANGAEIFETASVANGVVYWQSFEIWDDDAANTIINWPFSDRSVELARGRMFRSTSYVGSEYCDGPAAFLSHNVSIELSLGIPDA